MPNLLRNQSVIFFAIAYEISKSVIPLSNFVPVGIETYGAYGPQGIKLVKQIGKKIQDATGEKLSTFYLFQNISIAIQRGNAQCVQGCVKDRSSGLEGLFNFHVQEADEL